MATVNKDFKIKSGLIVEGTTGTINGEDILTTSAASTQHIIDIVGGETLITSVESTQLEVVAGELNVKANVFDAAGAAADAQAAAETFATNADTALYGTVTTDIATAKSEAGVIAQGYADTAESDAIAAAALDATSKADAAEAAAIAAAALDATSKADAAQSAAETFATNADTTLYGTVTTDIATAKSEAISTASSDATTKANAALVDAKAYTDLEVAALVDGAPALLDTLNELAAAIADNPNYATDVANLVATKADTTYVDDEIANAISTTTYTAGTNIDITGNVVSVTGLDSADISDFDTAAVSANTGLWDTSGSAASAEAAAKSYADGLAVNYDAAGAASTAESNANVYTDNSINALDTDDIEEGAGNLYFTDNRAQQSAMDMLTSVNTSLTNIQISQNAFGGLNIIAENGVADSTTDDLAEGDNNLYFSDERAIDAVSNADIYPNAVIIDNVAKQVAATLSATTAGIHVATAFAKADYRSAEFLVKVAYGDHTEISKVLLTLDVNDNIAITEYGIIGTNGSGMTVSTGISGTDVQLLVTTANNNSTVTAVGTLLV